ncbi:hypothetical protein [Parvicella tangerina]|uniref:Uncharacterized protein n=1 Tax=Parvicella tangerina TaxID=2829795 RepID=A0A916JJG7_9FLAO|nr:hypothetical protein [Parvicella tangerina]CAG5076713.1 hypothetical protein CRYO30217_00179 [Parvicella tangerina]
MKTASVREIKQELSHCTQGELIDIILRLSKHKKENKELLTYLIYESTDEEQFIKDVCEEVTQQFEVMNTSSYYLMKKSVRKVLRFCKKKIRFSKKKETEAEILLHFCFELRQLKPSYKNNVVLVNLHNKQVELIEKAVDSLHEDLQYDYRLELEQIPGY